MQLSYIYFYFNFLKDSMINSETKGRKEMEVHSAGESRQWQEMARVFTVPPILFQMIFTEELDKVQKAKHKQNSVKGKSSCIQIPAECKILERIPV